MFSSQLTPSLLSSEGLLDTIKEIMITADATQPKQLAEQRNFFLNFLRVLIYNNIETLNASFTEFVTTHQTGVTNPQLHTLLFTLTLRMFNPINQNPIDLVKAEYSSQRQIFMNCHDWTQCEEQNKLSAKAEAIIDSILVQYYKNNWNDIIFYRRLFHTLKQNQALTDAQLKIFHEKFPILFDWFSFEEELIATNNITYDEIDIILNHNKDCTGFLSHFRFFCALKNKHEHLIEMSQNSKLMNVYESAYKANFKFFNAILKLNNEHPEHAISEAKIAEIGEFAFSKSIVHINFRHLQLLWDNRKITEEQYKYLDDELTPINVSAIRKPPHPKMGRLDPNDDRAPAVKRKSAAEEPKAGSSAMAKPQVKGGKRKRAKTRDARLARQLSLGLRGRQQVAQSSMSSQSQQTSVDGDAELARRMSLGLRAKR